MKQPKSQTSFFSNSGELNIPMDLGMLLIGPGVSISSNSIMFAIKNWLHLAFSSETNVPTGIIPTTGKLGSREFAKNQALFYSDDKKSLDYALVLLKKRFDDIDITPSASIEQIRGIEGIKVKNLYKQIFGSNFKRNFSAIDQINVNINLSNNAIYNLVQLSCIQFGLSPHLGLIHKKRNSFVYDVSDSFKTYDYYNIIKQSPSSKDCLLLLNKYLLSIKFFNQIEDIFYLFNRV